MSAAYDVIMYIVNFLYSMVQVVFILRILFQLFRANASNTFCQYIARITNPVINPLRKYIPRTRYIDLSTLTAWLILDLLKYTLLFYMESDQLLSFFQILYVIPADFIMQSTTIIFYSVICHICLQIVAKGLHNTFTECFKILGNPALEVGRRILPYKGGFDFSWILVPISLKAIQYAIIYYIPARYFF